MVDDDAAREIVAELERQEEERKAEEAKKEEDSLNPPGQVVDLPTPREEKRPDDARFVSEHDSSVEHETKKYGRFEDKARQGNQNGSASVSRAGAAVRRRAAGDANARSREVPARSGAPGPAARAGRPGSAYGAPDPGPVGRAARSGARRRGRRGRAAARRRAAAARR